MLHYGSFAGVISAFAAYSSRIVVDSEGYYKDRQNELPLLFPEPLVIVDPVDRSRNVASAVQPQKLYMFIAAARAFQSQPTEMFFYPPKSHALSPDLIDKCISKRNSKFLFVFVGELDAVPDVLWGQLYRSKRSLRMLLETHGFNVLQDAVWSNEHLMSAFVFELEQQVLPNVKKHLGPPLERGAECDRFLAKYGADETVLAGPFIEDGRWVLMVPRKSVRRRVAVRQISGWRQKHRRRRLSRKAGEDEPLNIVNGAVLKVLWSTRILQCS